MILDFFDLIFDVFLFLTGKKSRRNSEWTGKVIERKTKSDYSLAKCNCYVVFETDDGKKIKIRMQESDFVRFELNKRYQKRAGNDLPELAPIQC